MNTKPIPFPSWLRTPSLQLLLTFLLFPVVSLAAEQTLTWASPTNGAVLLLNQAYPLEATASSGLPVTFSVKAGPAVIADGKVTATNVGTIVLAAEQGGNGVYLTVRETRIVNPVVVKTALVGNHDTDFAYGVHKVGELAYIADETGVRIVDVSNPAEPVLLGGYYTGRPAYGIKVVGSLAYVATEQSGLQILDTANPTAPVRLSQVSSHGTYGVDVVGNLAYMADGQDGLRIVDVSNPAMPVHVGGYNTRGSSRNVHVVGNLAYVADGAEGLQIIDVSNPTAPILLGAYDDGNTVFDVKTFKDLSYISGSAGLQILDVSNPTRPILLGSHYPGAFATELQVVENLAYVVAESVGLQIVDISNGVTPVLAGNYDTGGSSRGVHVVGDLACVADGRAGLQLIRLKKEINQTLAFDPPLWVSPADSPITLSATASSGWPVVFRVVSGPATLVDTQLILTGEGIVVVRAEQAGQEPITAVSVEKGITVAKELQTLNWASPTNRSVLLLNQAYSLTATASSGLPVTLRVTHGPAIISDGLVTATNVGTIVLAAEQAGDSRYAPVNAVRIANQSAAPVPFGNYDSNGTTYGLQVEGNVAYVADGGAGLHILDISNPATPSRLGSYDTSGTAYRVQVVGNLAYVADGEAGLQIIDVSNHAAPVRLGGYNTSGMAYGVLVVGNLAYVADGDAGLQIIDVSNPAAAVRVGRFNANGMARGVAVVGNVACVANGDPGLLIIDVSNPATPIHLGGYNTTGTARGVQIVGNLAYVADESAGLLILDISNPAAPIRIGSYNTSGSVFGLQIVGDIAYIADWGAGLQILTVGNPAFPVPIGSYNTKGLARNVWVAGNLVYVADYEAGLQVLSLRQAIQQTVTFGPPSTVSAANSPLTLAATSSSGLPVTFQVISGPATVSGNQLTLTGTGTVVVRAEQAGDEQFLPVSVERTLSVVASFRLAVPRLESGSLVLTWTGGAAPFTVWRWDSFAATPVEAAVTSENGVTLPADGASAFYQVRSAP